MPAMSACQGSVRDGPFVWTKRSLGAILADEARVTSSRKGVGVVGLTLADADRLAEIAQSRADGLGVVICVAILDEGGDLLRLSRMDGAVPAASEVAQTKAATARLLGRRTADLVHLSTTLTAAFSRPVALIGGGEPLVRQGVTAGAVGISGASEEQDSTIAREVAAAFGGQDDRG